MNKSTFYLLGMLIVLSMVEAATKKPRFTNLYEELLGAWSVSKSVVSISTGEQLEETIAKSYNFTKSDISNELVVYEVDIATKEQIRTPYEIIVSISDNTTAKVSKFEPGAEREVIDQMSVEMKEFIKEELYYGLGSFKEYPAVRFDVSLLPSELIKLEVDQPEADMRTIYLGKKIIVSKPKSFFQKYGSYLAIGLALVMQLVMTNMNQNNMNARV